MKNQIDIPGYAGRYYITYEGDVFRRWKTKDSKIISHRKSHTYVVRLTDQQGNRKMYSLSQLMRMTYFQGCTENLYHRNGLRSDFSVNNLQPITKQQLGKMTGGNSKSRPVCKSKGGKAITFYHSARQAAKFNFMSYQTVIGRCNGKVKSKYAPDGYEYQWDG
jgi:hypothetical protein